MIHIQSDLRYIDELVERIEWFLSQDILDMQIDGAPVRGYRSPDARSIWIRDYSDIIRGGRYFEKDLFSVVSHFAENQAANGRIFDYVTTFPEKPPCERENWVKYVRVPVEADVEYRFILAAWLCFQAHGDLDWLRWIMPHLQQARQYSMSHPQRWDPGSGLIKRAYTIDTWDFAYTAGLHDWLQFQIDEHTFWGIFHGDNSGLYQALIRMSDMHTLLDQPEEARQMRQQAEQLKARLNTLCWNGRFYQHFVKLSEVEVDGVNEAAQLSLSNPASLNRGCGTPEMARAMLQEYRHRQSQTGAFAPWFSIDPAFPDGIFGDDKLLGGAYINGGIFPLAGGELALLALESGFEKFGLEQILRYEELTRNRETYLWYFPDGKPSSQETSTSPEATPTDGWGSSAFLHAIVQGLAGVTDLQAGFSHLRFSPRWAAVFSRQAQVSVSYPASGAGFSYSYAFEDQSMEFTFKGQFDRMEAHIYVPDFIRIQDVRVGQTPVSFKRHEVNESKYIDFVISDQLNPQITLTFDPIRI